VNDFVIGMAVNVLLQVLNNARARNQWASAILKLFSVIAAHYQTVPDFQAVMNQYATQKRME
jgi:hypothetical protein